MICDLYDAGIKDDNLVLLHEANKNIHMAVKTPSGLTQRQVISNCVLQGDTQCVEPVCAFSSRFNILHYIHIHHMGIVSLLFVP